MDEDITQQNEPQPSESQDPSALSASGKKDQDISVCETANPTKPAATKTEPIKAWHLADALRRGWEFSKKPEATNVAMAIATVVIAIATCVTTYEIITGSDDTKKIVEAAQNIQNALNTANSQNLAALTQTLAQSRQAMDNSNAQSRTVLEANIAANQLDQRAWVGPVSIEPFEFKVGQVAPSITVTVRNSGKTPALHFTSDATGRGFPKGYKFQPIYPAPQLPRSIDIIQPNVPMDMVTAPTGVLLTQGDIEDVKAGRITMYVYGKMSYDDIFGQHHHTTYCLRVNTDLKSASTCDTYNEAD